MKRGKLHKVVYSKNRNSTTTLTFSAVYNMFCTAVLTFHHDKIPRQKKTIAVVPPDTHRYVYLLN
jgi:hypothetical protein